MVLQAKLERRQQYHSDKSCEESCSSMLGSIGNRMTGHPQSIPPPSEPVLPTTKKVYSPKTANGLTSTQMTLQAGESVPECCGIYTQSPPWFTEDKSEAKDSATIQKGELYCVQVYP